ncbi:hypothetical protein MBH78_14415 [Oceanimonas sp. NS1]|nr:hypothetical protein [Oceanimonas sp. NS1]
MENYSLLNWALLLGSFGVLILIGYLSSRVVKDSDETGFLVAGRSLGPFVGAGTIVATGFSGWGFAGSPVWPTSLARWKCWAISFSPRPW